MALVCGVNCSTLDRPNWVAWLDEDQFMLDSYLPSSHAPLPALVVKPGPVRCMAFDAPQGLPRPGERIRAADKDAGTPTQSLPGDRAALENWRARRGLIQVGISVFWWTYEKKLAAVAGMAGDTHDLILAESYPGYVIRRLWPSMTIPSKRRVPIEYVDTVYAGIQKRGYVCRSVIRPTVQQVDAMLCALAAGAFVEAGGLPAGTVGAPPVADEKDSVLRDGYIISG